MLLIAEKQSWEGDFFLVLSLHMARAAAPASLCPAAEHGIPDRQSFLPQLLSPPLPLRLGTSAARLSTSQLLSTPGLRASEEGGWVFPWSHLRKYI